MKKFGGITLLVSAASIVALPYMLTAAWNRTGLTDPVTRFQMGKAALDEAVRSTDTKTQTELVCRALIEFNGAMHMSPAEPRYQIAYADLLMEIGNAIKLCPPSAEPYKLDPEQILSNALKLAPYSTVDRYLAAVAFIRAGDKERGLALLREAQELDPLLSSAQRTYAYGLVSTEEELKTALPRTYPLVAMWVSDFYITRRDDYENWRTVFSEAVTHALHDLEARAKEERLSDEKFLHAVRTLWLLPLNIDDEELRRNLDLKYSELLARSGETEAARFFEERARMSRIPIVKSAIADKMPASGMLAEWLPDDGDTVATLGGVSRSVGFFIPEAYRIRTLVIEARPGGEIITPAELQFMESTDNFSYRPYSPEKPVRTFFLNGKQFVVINVRGLEGRYLKLHLPLIGKRSLPSGNFSSLIQAYGEPTP